MLLFNGDVSTQECNVQNVKFECKNKKIFLYSNYFFIFDLTKFQKIASMIRYFLLCTIFLDCSAVFAQQRLCFHYDTAGNQTGMTLCIGGVDDKRIAKPGVTTDTDSLTEDTSLLSADSTEEFVWNAAPNPTADNVTIFWHHSDEIPLVRLLVSTPDMQILYDTRPVSVVSKHDFSLGRYAAGTYYIIGIFADGSRKSIRLIKK